MTKNDISDGEQDYEDGNSSVVVSDESDRNGDATGRAISIFIGNLGDTTGPVEIKNLFESFGVTVDHVDMKICFAFVHCPWMENISEKVEKMQGCLFERSSKKPKIEITKGDGDIRRREEKRLKHQEPTTTLFVIGFDPTRTNGDSIVSAFSDISIAIKVFIRKNFCFVKFESIEAARKVKEKYHGKDVEGRTLSIEFSAGSGFSTSDRIAYSTTSLDSKLREDRGYRDGGKDRDRDRQMKRRQDPERQGNRGDSRSGNSAHTGSIDNHNADRGNFRYNENDSGFNSYDSHNDNRNDDGNGNRDFSQLYNDRERSFSYHRDRFSSHSDVSGRNASSDTRIITGNRKSNRSRSRETFDLRGGQDEGNSRVSISGHMGRHLDCSANALNYSNFKSISPSSVSLITLPFIATGGRFIYEHPDGRREYVDEVFSSSVNSSVQESALSNQYSSDSRYGSSRRDDYSGRQREKSKQDFHDGSDGESSRFERSSREYSSLKSNQSCSRMR